MQGSEPVTIRPHIPRHREMRPQRSILRNSSNSDTAQSTSDNSNPSEPQELNNGHAGQRTWRRNTTESYIPPDRHDDYPPNSAPPRLSPNYSWPEPGPSRPQQCHSRVPSSDGIPIGQPTWNYMPGVASSAPSDSRRYSFVESAHDKSPFRDVGQRSNTNLDRQPSSHQQILVHPLLMPNYPNAPSTDLLVWDMRFPPESNAWIQKRHRTHPFYEFDKHPITSPCLGTIILTSMDYPWEIVVVASNSMAGVTFGDLFDTLYTELDRPLQGSELRNVSSSHVQRIAEACKVRESIAYSSNLAYGTFKRIDWLVGLTAFCGVVEDSKAASDFQVPGTLAFICGLPQVEALRRQNGRR